MMKCDRCGLQSDVEQAFSREKRLLRQPQVFCPDCTVKRHAFSFVLDLAVVAGFGLLLYVLNPLSRVAAFYLDVAGAILLMGPLILFHELTHAAVAKLMGLRVFGIIVGIGKTIWSAKFLGLDWTINLLPLGGITFVGARPLTGIRWRLFLIYMAGPASHVLLAFLLLIVMIVLPAAPFGERLPSILLWTNILLAILNLIPRQVSVMTGMQGTDGWHLLRTPFMDEAELTRQYIGNYGAEAMQAYAAYDLQTARMWVAKALAIDPNSGVACNILGVIQMACQEYRDSRETFQRILELEDAREPGLHYLLLNNIAYLNALIGDPSLLPEADQLSAEALKHLPWLPAVIGTRGTVLVELGRFEEGITLLKKSMSLHGDKQGKALNACHVAIGELRRGDPDGARKYLATARTLDPRCFLLPTVEAEVSSYDSVTPTGERSAFSADMRPAS
jgi:tetratricopeptide (TPR) repeat protein